MFFKNKKFGFTLAEILITLGLIGAISALTIPTLAYNYRSKVLEEQFRSTYNDLRQAGSLLTKDNGDLGSYAQHLTSTNTEDWARALMSYINGGNSYYTGEEDITTKLRELYHTSNGPQGPYTFHNREQTIDICDNGGIWIDSKGRIWTFNQESAIVCVDINGTAAPNRINIDTFAFIPTTAKDMAVYVYEDATQVSNYSGQFALCDLELLSANNGALSNTTSADVEYEKGSRDEPLSAMDACPFNFPLDNSAPSWEEKDAMGNDLKENANYWKDYIHYR